MVLIITFVSLCIAWWEMDPLIAIQNAICLSLDLLLRDLTLTLRSYSVTHFCSSSLLSFHTKAMAQLLTTQWHYQRPNIPCLGLMLVTKLFLIMYQLHQVFQLLTPMSLMSLQTALTPQLPPAPTLGKLSWLVEELSSCYCSSYYLFSSTWATNKEKFSVVIQ